MGAQSSGVNSSQQPQATQLGLNPVLGSAAFVDRGKWWWHRNAGTAARAGPLGPGCQPALWALFQKMGPHPCLPFPGGDERPWAWRVPGVVLSSSNAMPGTRQENPRTEALFQGLLCSPFRGLRAERKNGQLAPGRQRGVSGVGAAGCSLLTGVQLSVGVASPWGAAH